MERVLTHTQQSRSCPNSEFQASDAVTVTTIFKITWHQNPVSEMEGSFLSLLTELHVDMHLTCI